MKDYITESAKKAFNNKKEFYLLNGSVPLYLIDKLPSHINISDVIKKLEKSVPAFLINMIEGIYVGDFKELKQRNIQAMFKDGVIYLSSFKNFPHINDHIIVTDICHEFGHALEDSYGYEIYGDNKIEAEYNGKKQKLFSLLSHEGYHFAKEILFEPRLAKILDNLLYHEIGYDKLSLITPGLFTSPYSVTTIREYFANGIEDYLLGDQDNLKKISPILYNKIKGLFNEVMGE